MANTLYILSDMTRNIIVGMSTNEKLDEANYDLLHLKGQSLLHDGDKLELFVAFMFALPEKDEHGKDITNSEQYQERIKACQAWFKRDLLACYIMLSCMPNDLVGEVECCPTTKYM